VDGTIPDAATRALLQRDVLAQTAESSDVDQQRQSTLAMSDFPGSRSPDVNVAAQPLDDAPTATGEGRMEFAEMRL
jgi:hypothetical protein